ncbi:MAG: hypothetical protein GF317_02710 [Candidatus Lokiarchaeota archaeon]|nr:hypothetical protein [Candidatus Lokiarchaeota archaeon]MBD3198818.1 hypothetical protein [Candidatus Lokiarchaeota archaeon]
MTEKGFAPLSSQLGIPGTSYRLQLGLINDKWASRILKGKNIIDSYVFKDEDVADGYPNQNLIVGWVLRTVAIPNINPHQVMKTTQALMKQARNNRDKQKVVAPVSETKEVELEKVPENELRRPKASGWVKEDAPNDTSQEEKRKAFQERLKAKKQESASDKPTRDLPKIPSSTSEGEEGEKTFCPFCGKDLTWKFCPYCGKPLPHN